MDDSRWSGARSDSLFPLVAGLTATLLLLLFIALPPQTAEAQCGTQMSSCRNCHEVKGQLKVNTKGEWHVAHAFGDFCATCHGGDARAKDAEPAHAAMRDPLQNVSAACATCHPADMQERADKFAKILGVTAQLGNGTAAATPVASAPSATPAASSGAAIGGCGPIDGVAISSIVDYNLRPPASTGANWGNVVLVAMILALGLVWAVMAYLPRIRAVRDRMVMEAASRSNLSLTPAVSRLMPDLMACDDETLTAIGGILQQGDTGTETLLAVNKLSPEWLQRSREADPADLALALTLALARRA